MSNDRLEPFNYHNIAFKRCTDIVSLGRLDRLWFFRHHWFLKIDWLGKNGVQGTNLLDLIISILGCLKSVQNSYFRSRPVIFQFSRALLPTLSLWSEFFLLWIWIHPLLEMGVSVLNQQQNGKQCKSWWDGSWPSHLDLLCLQMYPGGHMTLKQSHINVDAIMTLHQLWCNVMSHNCVPAGACLCLQ